MTDHIATGCLAKMTTKASSPVAYQLTLGDQVVDMAGLIGQQIRLRFTGKIHCIHCDRVTKKSFSQGYCYPCFTKLAQCDTCIMSPERCHFAAGTCREPVWAEKFCMTDHIVYLANSTGIKVGITRLNQIPTRWMDQGATQALPIFRVATRQQSGFVEDALRQFVADKTNWRKLLKGDDSVMDLLAERDQLLSQAAPAIAELQSRFGLAAIQALPDAEVVNFSYPVDRYLSKATTLNFDKTSEVEGVLLGIRGQYLLLDTGALNIRKFGGYETELHRCA